MIPKIIHYCWFGNNKIGENERNCIALWKNKMPDYQFIEWNEKNFDVENSCDYVKQAYSMKKWAFVSDYVRLYALYTYGGIYLDTDVEVLKSFDDLLENRFFLCAESRYSICTATIGAEKNSEVVMEILNIYNNKLFLKNKTIDETPNSQLIYNFLHTKYGYIYKPKTIQLMGIVKVFPEEYFSPINCYTLKEEITNNTISIHRYSGSWKSQTQKNKDYFLTLITRIIGEKNREFIKNHIKKYIKK